MGDYTKLSIQQANDIMELYDLGPVTEIFPLSLGISNSNYKITTSSKNYLLKVSNDKNENELKQEMRVLNYLNERGFEQSLVPYQTKDERSVYHYDQKFGVLFDFLDGIPPGPSDIACFEIGIGLATLHTLEHTDDLSKLRHHEDVGFGARQVRDFSKSTKSPKDYCESFNHIFPHGLHGFADHPWETGIVHGDLYSDNTLFKNEKLQTVLDFEQGGRGEYILDLGISLSGTCLEKGRISIPLIRSFLSGYESVRKLPKEEKIHLSDAIFLGLFSISLWRIKRFKEKNLNPLMTDSYRELLFRAEVFAETLKIEGSL
jgi:homoserine kinase type II